MKLMLKILVFLLIASTAKSQIYIKPNNSYGIIFNRIRSDSTLFYPTGCGVPSGTFSLRGRNEKMGALYLDSCGHNVYSFDPSDSSWTQIGGTPQVTSTHIPFGDIDNLMTDDVDLTYIASTNRLNTGTGNFADSLLVGRLRDGTTSDSIVVWDNITKALKKVVGSSLITASNGLTKTGNDIKLGGLLTGTTFIECEQNVFGITNTSQLFLEAKLGSDPNKYSAITLEPSGSLIIRQNLNSNRRADILMTNQSITLAIDYDLASFINVFKLDTTFTYHNTKLGIIDGGVASLTDAQIQSTLHVFGDASINLTPTGTGTDSVLVKGVDNKVYAVSQSSVGGGGSPGGSGSEMQYRAGSSTFGGASGTSWDNTNNGFTLNKTSLGVTQNNSSGFILSNTTAAAAGAQQISPPLKWLANGWKTDATAASQTVEFRSYVLPVQGTANPTGTLLFQSSINGGAYSTLFSITSGGSVGIGTATPGVTLDLGTSGTTVRTSVYRGNFYNDASNAVSMFQATTTQMLLGASGSAGAPFLSFIGDVNTGIFRPGADLVGITAGGTETIRVSPTTLTINGVQEFADNAAAITGGLTTGQVYRTGDVLKIVH